MLYCQFPSWKFGQFGSLGLVLPRPIGYIIHLAGERQHLKFPLNIFSHRWQSLSLFSEYFLHRLCLYFQFSKLLKCEFPAATRYLLRPLFCQYIQMQPVLGTELKYRVSNNIIGATVNSFLSFSTHFRKLFFFILL